LNMQQEDFSAAVEENCLFSAIFGQSIDF